MDNQRRLQVQHDIPAAATDPTNSAPTSIRFHRLAGSDDFLPAHIVQHPSGSFARIVVNFSSSQST